MQLHIDIRGYGNIAPADEPRLRVHVDARKSVV